MIDLHSFKRYSDLTPEQQKGAGVYAHIYGNQIAYIGCCINIKKRQQQHKYKFLDDENQNAYYNRIKMLNKNLEFYEQIANPLILELNPSNPSQSEADFIALFLKNDWQLYNSHINTNRKHSAEIRCWKCGKFKPRNKFSKSELNKACKLCQNQYYKSYWQRNSERIKEYRKDKYQYFKKLKQKGELNAESIRQ